MRVPNGQGSSVLSPLFAYVSCGIVHVGQLNSCIGYLCSNETPLCTMSFRIMPWSMCLVNLTQLEAAVANLNILGENYGQCSRMNPMSDGPGFFSCQGVESLSHVTYE